MGIKFTALRTSDGHAVDPTRPGATVAAGVGGFFQVLTTDSSEEIRVTVAGKPCEGSKISPRWPAITKAGKAPIVIEQVRGGKVIDSKKGSVEVVGASSDEPAANDPATPAEPKAK